MQKSNEEGVFPFALYEPNIYPARLSEPAKFGLNEPSISDVVKEHMISRPKL